MKPSIKTVAEKCGVSITAVSLVLNNKPNRISPEKRKLILQTAKDLNYRPNLISRSLVTKKSNIIGLLIPNINDIFYAELSQTLIKELATKGYTVVIGCTDKEHEMEKFYVNRFVDYGVEGVIVARTYDELDHFEDIISILDVNSIPHISTDMNPTRSNIPFFSVDQEAGAYIGLKHLINLGHKKIGLLTGPKNLILTKCRIKGVYKAIEEYKKDSIEITSQEGLFDLNSGYKAFDDFWREKTTAIFSFNDMMSYGLYKKAHEVNVKIPEDISLISFGNSKFNEVLNPPLTSIELPIHYFSTNLTTMMIDLINGKELENSELTYNPEIFIRKSTQKI